MARDTRPGEVVRVVLAPGPADPNLAWLHDFSVGQVDQSLYHRPCGRSITVYRQASTHPLTLAELATVARQHGCR